MTFRPTPAGLSTAAGILADHLFRHARRPFIDHARLIWPVIKAGIRLPGPGEAALAELLAAACARIDIDPHGNRTVVALHVGDDTPRSNRPETAICDEWELALIRAIIRSDISCCGR